MNLLFVGPNAPGEIEAIASFGDYTFAAVGSKILKFKRAKQVSVLEYKHELNFMVSQMLIIGDILIACCDDNVLRMWNVKTDDFFNEIAFPSNFTVSYIVHPDTYVNKILVASREGKMQIWNFNTLRMIYDFPNQLDSPITFLEQSPVVDVVAIGLLDGRIILHNIKVDKTILKFQQAEKVTGISFRTDGEHLMATSNNNGDVFLWDLENAQLFFSMKDAHDATINSLHFLTGQPILLTSGSDNSVKQWIFDTVDARPRLLKQRSGHHAPPSKIRFYGSDGHSILSIGRDKSLRFFSTIRDSQNIELSQGSIERKSKRIGVKMDDLKLSMPIAFDAKESKQKQWDNIITCHALSAEATTWSFQNKVIGSRLQTSDRASAKAVAISECGNFGFIGSAQGSIVMYNMQSGIQRQTFEGHTSTVTGLATDNLSRTLVSAGMDEKLCFWEIKTGTLLSSIELPAAATMIEFHQESGLIAIACEDICIRIVDFFTKKIVREFFGHRNRINDLGFSPDGRWVVSCGMDSTIRTWDLPSGDCVDCFLTDTIATSISFSPVGDFIATSHVNHLGIFLWANRSQYQSVQLRKVDDSEIFKVDFVPEEISSAIDEFKSLDFNDNLITMSSVPASRWKVLLNLDIIKKRNKPQEPPKQPERAPFFLEAAHPTEPEPVEQHSAVDFSHHSSQFTSFLENSTSSEAFSYLKTLPPAAADLELRLLEPSDEKTILFIKLLNSQAASGSDIELVHVYLNVFLKIHSDELIKNGRHKLKEALLELQKNLHEKWSVINSKLESSLSLLSFIKK